MVLLQDYPGAGFCFHHCIRAPEHDVLLLFELKERRHMLCGFVRKVIVTDGRFLRFGGPALHHHVKQGTVLALKGYLCVSILEPVFDVTTSCQLRPQEFPLA